MSLALTRIPESGATAVETPMHAPQEAWQLNRSMLIDQEEVEPTFPSSLSRKRKAQQIAEDINKQFTVSKKPAAAPNKVPKSKAAPTKNKATPAENKTHVAREDDLLPNTVCHNGKDRLELCGLSTNDQGCKTKTHHILIH